MKGSKLLSIPAGLAGLAAAVNAHALEWYFQAPGSQLAREIDHLHQYVMWLIIVIFVVVFGFMFWACYAHRKSKGHAAEQFHENTTVEILWTVIPAIILIGIAWPVTKVVIAQKDTSAPDITVKVTGYQWKWGYDYIKGEGEGISFVSMLTTPRDQIEGKAPKGEHYLLEVDNEMVVPVGKKIRVITTAADVIHSWWVPAFGAALLAQQDDPNKKWDTPDLLARGEKVYGTNCVACHQPTGRGMPPAFPPLVGSKLVTGAKEGHIDIVLNGKSGTAMAPFGKQLSDTEIAAVISYERSTWGNKSGIVQPAEVKARRK